MQKIRSYLALKDQFERRLIFEQHDDVNKYVAFDYENFNK